MSHCNIPLGQFFDDGFDVIECWDAVVTFPKRQSFEPLTLKRL